MQQEIRRRVEEMERGEEEMERRLGEVRRKEGEEKGRMAGGREVKRKVSGIREEVGIEADEKGRNWDMRGRGRGRMSSRRIRMILKVMGRGLRRMKWTIIRLKCVS